MIHRVAFKGALLVLLCATAAAQAASQSDESTAAQAALNAFRAGDAKALAALADRDEPDPFTVAHELVLSREFEAAAAFGKAARPRPRAAGIAEFVAARRVAPEDPALARAAEALRRAEAASSGPQEVLALLEPLGDPKELPDPMAAARILWTRAFAYERLGRRAEALADYEAVIPLAEKAGWRGGVVAGTYRAGICCEGEGGDAEACLEWRRRLVTANEAMEEPKWLAFSLARYGAALARLRHPAEARPVLDRALTIEKMLGEDPIRTDVASTLGSAYFEIGRYAVAADLLERAARAFEAAGNIPALVSSLQLLGICWCDLDPRKAVEPLDRAMALATRSGDVAAANRARGQLATNLVTLGDIEKALGLHEEELRVSEVSGDVSLRLHALTGIADIRLKRGEFSEAIATYRAVLTDAEENGLPGAAATVLSRLGLLYQELGDYPRSLEAHRRCLELTRRARRSQVAAMTLNLATVRASMGDYPEALATFYELLPEFEKEDDQPAVATIRFNLACAYSALGDPTRALEQAHLALAIFQRLGDEEGTARLLGNMGTYYAGLGEADRAIECFTKSLASAEARGDRLTSASARSNIAQLRLDQGDAKGAEPIFSELLEQYEAMGATGRATVARISVGSCLLARGETRAAIQTLERAVRETERSHNAPMTVHALTILAKARFLAGEPDLALATARRAAAGLETIGGGEADEQSAALRGGHREIFVFGALAAVNLGDAAELAYFLESGRAGALTEGVANREAIRAATLPADLREREATARAAVAAAAARHAKAQEGGARSETAARGEELTAAEARLRETVEAIERAQKRAADILYPRAAPIEEIEAALSPAEALVLYGLFPKQALALVVTASGARIVDLGPTAAIRAACDALAFASPESESGPAVEAAAKLLAAPLGLEKEVTRVLVSPEGPASYAPIALLFPDREVAFVPSGTAWLAFREERVRAGKDVLAVGDPDYDRPVDPRALEVYAPETRGGKKRGRLAPLPATASEAKAVGDRVLLRGDATEEGFLAAIKERKRWRAVHFACHGLIDPERPTFSSLALTGTGTNDGFLTALDVFRAKIPADLAVLSACETAKGKVVAGEGIVGLTRAFMFAGAPRVLCSLWKVDDEATAALMKKFYELWNPKGGQKPLSTAAALRAAQDHVRSNPRWSHPHYWAAWVLWGLAE